MNPNKTKNTFFSPKDVEEPESFPSISKPKIVGAYSVDSVDKELKYMQDRRNCKYLYRNYDAEPVQYDLNEGIENVIRKIERSGVLHGVLQFILENIEKLKQSDKNPHTKFLSADVVTIIGLLECVMCAPYSCLKPWRIMATNYKGTIYMCGVETNEQAEELMVRQIDNLLNIPNDRSRILSYGIKFEHLVFTGKILLNFFISLYGIMNFLMKNLNNLLL